MNKAIFIILLVGGATLIVFGIGASQSLASAFARFFTDSPTDKAIWMLLGGTAMSIVGLVGLLRSSQTYP